IKWLPKIIEGVDAFMDTHGYESVHEMIGLASKRSVKDYSEQFSKNRMHAVVNEDTCKNPTCNICIQVCFYEALSQNPDGRIDVHADNCIGCELCLDVCPFDSVEMKETSSEQLQAGFFDIPDAVFETGKFKTNRNNMDTIRANSPKFKSEAREQEGIEWQ
ncbi:MAG: 4Fe-4S dicluster domain-containing protein, partial [Boseongicola sp.]|nr:4Fe-4S dicluster domain-containing protein [Boseongicola sp.]